MPFLFFALQIFQKFFREKKRVASLFSFCQCCGMIFAKRKNMLTDSQKKQVAAWVAEGLSLAQIQTNIERELGIAMTYMDVRFLVDDLGLELGGAPAEKSPATEKTPDAATPADEPVPASAPGAPTGGVSLSVDPVQMAGEIASGDVVFSDGTRGKWFIDRTGRAGLDGFPAGYQPPAADVPEFQKKLVAELQKLGLA